MQDHQPKVRIEPPSRHNRFFYSNIGGVVEAIRLPQYAREIKDLEIVISPPAPGNGKIAVEFYEQGKPIESNSLKMLEDWYRRNINLEYSKIKHRSRQPSQLS